MLTGGKAGAHGRTDGEGEAASVLTKGGGELGFLPRRWVGEVAGATDCAFAMNLGGGGLSESSWKVGDWSLLSHHFPATF